MVREGPAEINHPSARVRGQELLLIPISGSQWRNSGIDGGKESDAMVFREGCKLGKHGEGGACGDQSSLRQGAGTRTSTDPDLGIAVAEQWHRWRKRV